MVNAPSRRGAWVIFVMILLHVLVCAVPMHAQQQIVIVPNGQAISAPSDIVAMYETLVGHWINMLQRYANELFWALAFLDIAWFAVEVVLKYRLNVSLAVIMTTNKILIIGFFLALLTNASDWIPAIVNAFPQLGQIASGVNGIMPSELLKIGVQVSGKLLWAAAKTTLLVNISAALALVLAAAGIILGFAWITVQFVIAKVETVLAIGLGFIFVAFGGSRWTVPYVKRYWTFAITAGVKMMTFYMVLGAGIAAAQNWVNQVNNLSFVQLDVPTAFAIMAGVIVWAGVCFSTTKLAGAVLGGSPMLSGADMAAVVGAGAT